MALVLADRVRETSTTTGTGTFTLAGAVAGFQSFSAIGNANTTYYTITDLLGNFEVGIGTYTASGTSLSRTTVLSSSNANALVSFPAGTKDVFVTYPAEKSVNYNASDNVVITANTTTAALTVTQTGTGNAFVVEDSASPDSTPFIIDFAGGIIQGYDTFLPTDNYAGNSMVPNFQKHGGAISSASIASTLWNSGSGSNAGGLVLSRSKSATIGTNASVVANDTLGTVSFNGDDGAAFIVAASIQSAVDGTPSADVMPGRLVFATTAAGASAPTERMRIDSAGQVSIGTSAAAAGRSFTVSKPITGSASSFGVLQNGQVQSDSTSVVYGVRNDVSTAAAAFTVPNYYHFFAQQNTIGAGSAITSQYGFYANTTLTGATNNYGFYGNIAAGTGRYNLYMNGTAENYLGGATSINVNDDTNAALHITQLGTGDALLVEDSTSPDSTPVVITNAGYFVVGYTNATPATFANQKFIQSHSVSGTAGYTAARWDATANGPQLLFGKSRGGAVGTLGIVAADDILGQIVFSGDDGVDLVTSGAQIIAKVDGTPGLNDMPGRLEFYTTADGASVSTERMRIDSAGQVSIGTSAAAAGTTFRLSKNITGSATAQAVNANGAIQSDVTGGAQIFRSSPSTQATVFTLGALDHFLVNPQAFGAGSVVTNQYGFNAASSLTGATNNYGFYGNIAAGTGRYNFYAAGTADNYFAGVVSTGSTISDVSGDVRSIPQNAKTASYTLLATDNGKHISITTGGVTVPASVFSVGQVVTIFNNSASAQTITQGASVTMYNSGNGGSAGNRTLGPRGLATVLCVATNTFAITGAGLT